jgi:transcription elongation GreA/GreB family factor
LSYISPLASSMLGAGVGAAVQIGSMQATIARLEV